MIEPFQPMYYDIDTLVGGITDENRYDPVDMGEPIGREVW